MTEPEPQTPTPERVPDQPVARSFRYFLLIVVLYAAAVYLPFLGSGRRLTRHEVDIAQPAMGMIASGDYIVPYYEGTPWVHKPPLAAWMAVPFYAVAGFSEFGTRLPSALCAIGLCIMMTVLARRYSDARTALFTGLVQASCVYMFMQGRLGEHDMPLAFCVTGANTILAWHWGGGRLRLPLPSAALLHVLVGLGMLAKGPIAAVFVGLTVVAFAVVRRSFRPVRLVVFTPAILCSIVISFGWVLAVGARIDDLQWVLQRWFYSNVSRAAGAYHMNPDTPLAFYLWTIPWLVLPWSIVLLIRIRRLIHDAGKPDAALDKFLWCWFFAGLIFLSLVDFKHKHYCIPILPPLSIFAGRLLAEHAVALGRRARAVYIPIFAAILLTFLIVGGIVMPRRDYREARVQFVRREVPQIPDDATVHVLDLQQAAIYPYVEVYRPCEYFGTWSQIAGRIREHAGTPLWVLTRRAKVEPAAGQGIQIEEVAREPAGKKFKPEERLVLLRAALDDPQ